MQYYTGLANYRWGDVVTAETCFDSFIKTFPLSPFSDRANYYYVDCLYQQTLRYELDQTPTYKAMDYIQEYIKRHPTTEYKEEFQGMLDELNERLDKKALEGAKIYYHTEDYKAAQYAFKNVLKEDASNIYREEILYFTAMSSYKYAFNSVFEKQKERYMTFADDYFNFISESLLPSLCEKAGVETPGSVDGKSFAQLLGQDGHGGVFGVEVAGVDEVHAQLISGAELVVLDVGGDEGVAAGIQSLQHCAGAAAAANGDFADALAAVHIAKTAASEVALHISEKIA